MVLFAKVKGLERIVNILVVDDIYFMVFHGRYLLPLFGHIIHDLLLHRLTVVYIVRHI